MERVYNFLKNDIKLNKNDTVVVGVSAGPDSMALLYVLKELRKNLNFKIVVAHINHNVRKESYEEYDFLEKYCNDNDITFEGMVIEKMGDDNFHNEARNIRYNFYKSLIDKYNANYLMTGHHGDDLMETILMRIVRGSSLKGYSGFQMIVDRGTYKIIRPLVFLTKEEIEIFDKKNKIEYRIDQSNLKDHYTRNRYRHEVLPFLKKEDINVHEKFLRFSNTLNEYDEYIGELTQKAMKDVYSDGIINVEKFAKVDYLLQKRIIDYILTSIYKDDLLEIDNRHVQLILECILSKKTSMKFNLPNDYLIIKEYNKAYFKKVVDEINIYDIELNDEVILPNGMKIVKCEKCDTNGNDVLRLSSKDVVLPLRVRSRKLGDKMNVMNMDGTKKVSDIFINSKIPFNRRNNYPIVVDSKDKIVWIPGVKKSKYNRLKNEDCDIIYKCI